jgi:hypothetical protein
VDGIAQADLRRALWEERSLVKAWTIRGTLHIHPADELPLWLAAARAVSGDPGETRAWVDPEGMEHPALGREEVDEIRGAVLDALDGRSLLREELAAAVAERLGPKARSRLRSGFAFFGGAELCQGPPQGTKITLVRPDQWLGRWELVDEQAALVEVCRRYLRAFGPVRPDDFRLWLSSRALNRDRARALFESLDLEMVEVEGREAFVLAGDTAFGEAKPSLRLLPEYDVYVMGFREREQLVPEAVKEQIARHGRGRYEGPAGVRLLLVDGVAAGLWQRRKRGKRIELDVSPSRRLTRTERAQLDDEAERMAAFLGLEPVLTVGTPA